MEYDYFPIWLLYTLLIVGMCSFAAFFYGRDSVQDELLKYKMACFAREFTVHCMHVTDEELR